MSTRINITLTDEELAKIITAHRCPMTQHLCDRYGLTPGQIRAFCYHGCSPDCAEEFARRFAEARP